MTLIFEYVLPEKAVDNLIKYFIGGFAIGSFVAMFIVKSKDSDKIVQQQNQL
jgi:hypothetical protein